MQFHLFLPQMRLSFERLVASAQAAEAAGFGGIAGMDHMIPPAAEDQPMYEAMVTNTWLAAHTSTLKVGSLVLCDAFRHPALLAREAVSIDHASGGRFELAIGWGSWENDFVNFGLGPEKPRDRVERLRETLTVVKALWAGETVTFEGRYHHLTNARQVPGPLARIPIIVGGGGPKTLALVRDFADWANLDVRHLDKLEGDGLAKVRDQIGSARISSQEMVAFVPRGGDRAAIADAATKRFGHSRPVIGTSAELIDHFARRAERGVERTYVWFCDFGKPETLTEFGEEVIVPMRPGN